MPNLITVLIGVMVISLLAGYGVRKETFGQNPIIKTNNRRINSRAEIKTLFPNNNVEWLEGKYDGREFIFCSETVLPIYGVSNIDIHGWVYRPRLKCWEKVFIIHTNGLGRLDLSIDQDSGQFSAMGTANNEFKDKEVFTFDLDVTVR